MLGRQDKTHANPAPLPGTHAYTPPQNNRMTRVDNINSTIYICSAVGKAHYKPIRFGEALSLNMSPHRPHKILMGIGRN